MSDYNRDSFQMNGRHTGTLLDRVGQVRALDEVSRYTASVFCPDDVVEIRFLPSKRSIWPKVGELSTIVGKLRSHNTSGQNIYIGVNPRKSRGGKKADDVALARVLVADFDGITLDESLAGWNAAGLPESSLILSSGHGFHFYLRLREPITDLTEWTRLQKALNGLVRSDPVVHDPPRIMRLPGFTNHKPPAAPCSIISTSKSCVMVSALITLLTPSRLRDYAVVVAQEAQKAQESAQSAQSVRHFSPVEVGIQAAVERAIVATLPTPDCKRHRAILNFCRRLKAIPELSRLPASFLRPHFQEWWLRALPFVEDKSWDEAWRCFCSGWVRVWKPAFSGPGWPPAVALAMAEAEPFPAAAMAYCREEVRRLIALCRKMVCLQPGSPRKGTASLARPGRSVW
jgi:hypothetical protein